MSEDVYDCPECGKNFDNAGSLTMHRIRAHRVSPKTGLVSMEKPPSPGSRLDALEDIAYKDMIPRIESMETALLEVTKLLDKVVSVMAGLEPGEKLRGEPGEEPEKVGFGTPYDPYSGQRDRTFPKDYEPDDCDDCGNAISSKWEFCSWCGKRIEREEEEEEDED